MGLALSFCLIKSIPTINIPRVSFICKWNLCRAGKKWNSIHVISVIMAWNHPFATPKEGGLPKQRQHQRGPSCLGGCEFDAAGRVYVTWEKSAAIGRFETGNERSYSIVVLVVYRRYSVALAAASFSNPYTASPLRVSAKVWRNPFKIRLSLLLSKAFDQAQLVLAIKGQT